ncbi:glycosyltransferase [Roseococcus sp. SYP-B2431]|uniref:glycosyltransferase n=1 Tax=Roseococcus sp. SYP-B2431 TaxID=2496640 RepID=UPI0013F40F1C|nr:glycosyltransferase [Roseococcus sp. SYP-B2431]
MVGLAPRYFFASGFVAGRRVLDLDCGDGAGAAMLAAGAAQVTAIAPSAEAAGAAAGRHRLPNLEFLPPGAELPEGADVVLALSGRLAEIPGIRRLLRPGGLLIAAGDPAGGVEELLRAHFAEVAVLGEGGLPAAGQEGERFFGAPMPEGVAWTREGPVRRPETGPLLLASDAPLPPEPGAGGAAPRIAALLAELDRLRDELADCEARARATGDRLEIERQRANAIETSTIWRASGPLRRILSKFPGLRRALREGLRRIYRSRHTLRHRRVRRRRQSEFAPLVSAIVPNFNHARFLPQRLDSILGQAYPNLEVIVLDDASTDDSLAVIERYRAAHPERIRVIANAENSGNVFRQWRRGVEEARGDLLWICESDDFAEADFLQALVPAFLDESVMIGFGRIQFADAAGKPYAGLDAYRERSQPGIWKGRNLRPAKAWFDTAFGVHNVIANVGGCLLRAQPVEEAVWREAATYGILGDWYLYASLARGGRIAYEPQAVSYFRQHGGNTSASAFGTAAYYAEHERLIRLLRARWGVPEATVHRFAEELRAQFDRSAAALGPLETVFDEAKVLATPREGRHVLMVLLGFYLGGGEIFPIHLANELVRRGVTVSVLALQPEDWNPGIRARLDRRIPVYGAAAVRARGPAAFLAEAGVDVVHSHFVGAEHLFLTGREVPAVPYVASMHGSYEVTAVDPDFTRKVARHVDLWVYLTEKNLDHLRVLSEAERAAIATRQIPNGMPPDPRPFGRSRAELGIGEDDLVFALASRAIPEKGWAAAIEALALAQSRTGRRLHLLLCGDGPEADRLGRPGGGAPGVIFLGFQERVQGVYRLADVVLLPTRFAGESFPLALVQAMQEGRPAISTDLGEIARMLLRDGRRAGIVLAPDPDDARFVAALAGAMLAMTDDTDRAAFARDAAALGAAYGMETVAAAYLEAYEAAAARRA